MSPEWTEGIWRRRPELNRGMEVLQTSALPLGYGAPQTTGQESSGVANRSIIPETRSRPLDLDVAEKERASGEASAPRERSAIWLSAFPREPNRARERVGGPGAKP